MKRLVELQAIGGHIVLGGRRSPGYPPWVGMVNGEGQWNFLLAALFVRWVAFFQA